MYFLFISSFYFHVYPSPLLQIPAHSLYFENEEVQRVSEILKVRKKKWWCSLVSNTLSATDSHDLFYNTSNCVALHCSTFLLHKSQALSSLSFFIKSRFSTILPSHFLPQFAPFAILSAPTLPSSSSLLSFSLLYFFLCIAFSPLSLLPSPLFDHSMLGIPRSPVVHSQALEESIVFLSACSLEKE